MQNNGSLLGVFDEFSTLIDSLDKGTTGSSEIGRYLSLYSAVDWSKKTKTSGNIMNMHFLITVPGEVYVKMDEKEAAFNNTKDIIDLNKLLELT